MLFKLFVILTILHSQYLFSQKNITIEDLETIFQKNKVTNIAESYNIDIAKANLVQAQIWEQPYFSAALNLYNPDKNKFFDAGAGGEKEFAIEQLIYLGGKKGKEIDFQTSNLAIAEMEFEKELKSLNYNLKTEFYNLYFELKRLNTLNQILKIISVVNNNNVTEINSKENNSKLIFTKLKIKNEIIELKKKITLCQDKIKNIAGIEEDINPIINESQISILINSAKINLENLVNKENDKFAILENNIELKMAKIQLENSEKYLQWQQSMDVPDLNMGLSYDQRGGAFFHQINLTFGFNLPLWDKNEGNTQIADINKNQITNEYTEKETELLNKIKLEINKWEEAKNILSNNEYKSISNALNAKYEELQQKVTQNSNQLKIDEVVTELDDYKNSSFELINFESNLINIGENIMQLTGIKLK